MPKSRPPYPPEYRQKLLELVRKGRTPEELARQFAPSAQAILNWARQADRDAGRRQDGLTTAEAGDHLDPVQGFEFVTPHQAFHRVATTCRVQDVSRSGYYAWRKRPPSPRACADVAHTAQIEMIHREARGTYGAPRAHAELAAQGIRIGRKRVARLMRAAHRQGVSRRKRFVTTRRDPAAEAAPDLVKRDFHAAGPNQLWVADITYITTGGGFLYLAVVLDAWSRRVVGWAMATHRAHRAGHGGARSGPAQSAPMRRHPPFRSLLLLQLGRRPTSTQLTPA